MVIIVDTRQKMHAESLKIPVKKDETFSGAIKQRLSNDNGPGGGNSEWLYYSMELKSLFKFHHLIPQLVQKVFVNYRVIIHFYPYFTSTKK